MRGVSFALGEIGFFLVLAGVIGVGIGFVLRDWLFANRADELDEILREERAEYRRLESTAALREHQMRRTIVAREAAIEELEAGRVPDTMVLGGPFRPGSVLRPPTEVAVTAAPPGGADARVTTPSLYESDGEDDLQRIRGVGPTIAHRLNEEGIHTYRQLAALTPDQMGALADAIRIARGRVARDDWGRAAAALDAETRGRRR